MEKKRNSQTIIIAILAVAVLFMSVGFAAFAQTLNIQGNVTVEPTKWSVHWDTASYVQSSGSVPVLNGSLTTGTTPTLTNTDVTFGAKLEKPGDFAEFTIDAINDGDFDAKLTSITLSPLTTAQSKYLTYTVTYNGVEYSATTTGLNISLPATGTNTVTVKVRVEYITPGQASELPTEAANITLSASFDYEQAV